MNRCISQFLEFYRRKEKPRGLDFDHFSNLFFALPVGFKYTLASSGETFGEHGDFPPKKLQNIHFPDFFGGLLVEIFESGGAVFHKED